MIEYEIHAGIGHKSPYMEALKVYLKKYGDIKAISLPYLPERKPLGEERVIHLHRLGRLYNGEESLCLLINKIDKLKKVGWKFVWTIHNFFPLDSKMEELDFFAIKQIGKRMDIIFCHTNEMKKNLMNVFDIQAINHRYGADYHIKKNEDSCFKNKKIFDNNDFTFGFIGNIRDYKGITELIHSYNKLISNKERCNLLIAGCSYETYLEDNPQIIANCDRSNVILYDQYVYKEDWEEIQKNVDVFVFPYKVDMPVFKYGFFASAIAQAVYMKKMIVCPENINIKDIIGTLKYSFTYLPEKKDGLYNSMLASMREPREDRIIKEKKLYNMVSENTWDNLAQRIVKVYNDSLNL